jgi:glycosyltransferase involved in cell wall biosynthesis
MKMLKTNNDKVSILCADVGINCLSRAITLAEIVSRDHEVQIIGFVRNSNGIWPPARTVDIPIKVLDFGWAYSWYKARTEISSLLNNSSLIICKPRLTSMGLAMLAGCEPQQVILDINDWELGLALESNRADGHFNYRDIAKNLASPNSPLLALYFESKIRQFPHRIVNNHWLQNRFGGELIYDVRDTDQLDPAKYDKRNARAEIGLDDRPWVVFAGTPRPHKGVINLILALEQIKGQGAPGLLVCGGGVNQEVIDEMIALSLAKLGNSRFHYIKQYNRLNLPEYLSAVDIVCIPSLLSSNTVGQVPTKLFEAMAMGLPVITTQVCDMKDLVEGIGFSVPPGNINALSGAINSLCTQPDLCVEMGRKARDRAVHEFSYNSAQPALQSLLEKIRPGSN